MAESSRREHRELLEAAVKVREAAYAPYSGFKVGAAARSASGRIFIGCNIENASYGLSICAERVAIFSAVAAGEPKIRDIAIVTDAPSPSRPCGACRQVLQEFGPDATVIMSNLAGSVIAEKLENLFPQPFKLAK